MQAARIKEVAIIVEQLAIKQRQCNVAIYMRLSKDDDLSGDSESIQNQRMILRKYAEEKGWVISGEYIDDGWSGTNFNRPGFKKMIEEIEKKGITCIITKDLSRLGRNYLEVGYYTETYFPSKGIRYIAVNDNVDTAKGDSDLAPFMNIFNEFHAKQTSRKVRQVYESKFTDGACHYTYPPLGYVKDPDKKCHLIPDEETAWIIQKIFELADSGMGAYSIQKWLFEHKVETPGYVCFVRYGAYKKTYANANEDRKYDWGLANIKKILKDTVYIGSTTHYKKRSISFKNKQRVKLPEDQWIVVENTHEALVDKDVFDRVQHQIASRKRTTLDGEVQIFSGLAVCADCGGFMRFATNRQRKGFEYQYLACGMRSESQAKPCTLHYIRYDTLKSIILKEMQDMFKMISIDQNALVDKLSKRDEDNRLSNQRKELEEYHKLEARNNELKNLFPRMYEDFLNGRINEQVFSMMSAKYQEEQIEVERRMQELKRIIDIPKQRAENTEKYVSIIKSLSYPTELTRELVNALIEKIVVHESIGPKRSRKKTCNIEIYWKFIGFVGNT